MSMLAFRGSVVPRGPVPDPRAIFAALLHAGICPLDT